MVNEPAVVFSVVVGCEKAAAEAHKHSKMKVLLKTILLPKG